MKRWLAAIMLASALGTPVFADEWLNRAACEANRIQDYYPPEGIRREKTGTLLVEFSVKGIGPPTGITVMPTRLPGYLQDAAARIVRFMTCRPDSKWIEDGGPERRLRLNVIFRLKGVDETPGRLDPDADEVVITGAPIVPR